MTFLYQARTNSRCRVEAKKHRGIPLPTWQGAIMPGQWILSVKGERVLVMDESEFHQAFVKVRDNQNV